MSTRHPHARSAIISDPTPPHSRRAARQAKQASSADGTPTEAFDDLLALQTEESVPRKKKKRRRRVWPWIVFPLLVILVILGGAAVVGYIFYGEATQVRDDLTAAKKELSSVTADITAGDTAAVEKTAAEVTKHVNSANARVSTPLWDIMSKIPVVGENVEAVQETTKATHILVRDAMPLAFQLLQKLNVDNLKLEGGGFNLQPFRDAQTELPALTAAFADAKTHVDKIDRSAILPFVDDSIGQLVDIVDQATPSIALAQKYLPTLLTVLGGDGPRDYAILFQNNAEIRATGGNPGTAAILHVDNGKIEMREDWEVMQYAWLGYNNTGMPPIEPSEKAQLFESDTWKYVQNFTRYPDFRDTGAQISTLWNKATGTNLAGVISIDPVFLSYMLKVTGPVTVPGEDEKITADNAVKLLLSDTYERFGSDGLAADEYFAKASSAIFAKVSAGGWDPIKMFEQFQRGVAEQRFYMWFPDEATQAMAVEFGVDGGITSDNKTKTQTGIYLNDVSVSKLDYWLSTKMDVQCNADARTVTTSVTMTNSLPDDIYSTYTLGHRNSGWGFPKTTALMDVISMALPGGELVGSDPAAGDVGGWDRSGVYNGRQTKSMVIGVPKGESRTVSFTSTVAEGDNAPLSVRFSPTTSETPVTVGAGCATLFPGTQTTAK